MRGDCTHAVTLPCGQRGEYFLEPGQVFPAGSKKGEAQEWELASWKATSG